MADFQEVGKQWARMCKAFRSLPNGCSGCPLVNEHCYHESPFVLDFDRIEYAVMQWAKKNPELVYPTWGEWLYEYGVVGIKHSLRYEENWTIEHYLTPKIDDSIPTDIAEKLGIEPKEDT